MIRTGTICLALIKTYFSSLSDNKDECELGRKSNTLKCLKDSFENLGGVFSKLAQMLCIEDSISDNKVFSECRPVNMEKTIVFLKNEFETNKDFFKGVDYIDFDVYKSGSIGQVHKGKMINGDDIIVKVQYHGIAEQINSDLKIFEQVINFLYSFVDLKNALKDIKIKLNEELDYNYELRNQKRVYDIWNNSGEGIEIPEIIPGICSDKIICMKFVSGESLHDFIVSSSQEEKNLIAYKLIKFIFTNIYKHRFFYSDIHYGNFLIQDKEKLIVMDFGCVNEIEEGILVHLKNVYRSLKNDDQELFFKSVKSIGIIDNEISPESKKYAYDYLKLQYRPWITNEKFDFTNEYLSHSMIKDTNLMKEWKIPPSMVYLNKIPYGLYHVLTKLNASGNFSVIFDELLNE
jgi:predicted unusual protein kinase regulating ubiquinone biosynthesis (AarF/ABC1/UbiB family)